MDSEKPFRDELEERLTNHFHVEQEVTLKTISGESVRADLIATPVDEANSSFIFVFEAKLPAQRNFQKWCEPFQQATNYVRATICSGVSMGNVVNSAFVFPAPPYVPYGTSVEESQYWRNEQISQLAGVIHLASYLKVGTARIGASGKKKELVLSFGPNEIWRQGFGWINSNKGKLLGRRIGSRKLKVDV